MWKRSGVAALVVGIGLGGVAHSGSSAQPGLGEGDDCAGIVPDALPESRSIVVPHRDGGVCRGPLVDGQGHLAVHGAGVGWSIFTWDGLLLGTIRDNLHHVFNAQPSGFQGTLFQPHPKYPLNYLAHWNPDGSERNRSFIGAGDACGISLFPIIGGGSQGNRSCGIQDSLLRFDEDGQFVAGGPIERGLRPSSLAVDVNGLTAALFRYSWENSNYVVRWFDVEATPVSDFFGDISRPGNLPTPLVQPLINSGLVVQLGGDWVAMLPSGEETVTTAPEWLKPYSNYDLDIVRGRRAYALVPKAPVPDTSTILLYSARGNYCGYITFPLPNLTVGTDGTVVSSTGKDGCSVTWWPHVLR